MITPSDILHLSCTPDLIQGGIAYALHSLPYNFQNGGRPTYDRLRQIVSEAAVEIAFRRYLSEQDIPFDVKAALPFTGHDRYDVVLGGRRCEIKSFLIHEREQISQMQREPELLLKAQVLVASDQHAAEGHSPRDLYLFAFLVGEVITSRAGSHNLIEEKQPHYLVHVMPAAWNRPAKWNPLGKLVLKSESEETQTIELGGRDEGGAMCSHVVELLPRRRLEIPSGLFSLSYVHTRSGSPARIGIHSPVYRETYIIEAQDWGNLWVYSMDLRLAGYLTREEFRRRANFIPVGLRVFPYKQMQVKNLAVPVSELRPLSELLEHAHLH
jgi:hypothetical protein